MPYQNINTSISTADLQAVKDAFATIKQKLPFLRSLTNDERRSIVKTGPGSLSFVTKALSAAQENPDIFPGSFDTAAFALDCDLFAAMTELNTQANQVAEQIDDTRMGLGGEAMRQAMQVYEYVKTGAKTNPGLKTVADELGERFKKSGGSKPPGTPPATPQP